MQPETKYRIYLKGEDRTNDVSSFKNNGATLEVTFHGGKPFTYNAGNVEIIHSITNEQAAGNCLLYLNEIANEIGIKSESENGEQFNILSHYFSQIGFVPHDGMLGVFLSGRLIENSESEFVDPIYPFGLNLSQKEAVDNALNNKLSIIEGPPGTGKTQTILNIIANLVMRGQSVAVVSSNNSATKNVHEKLMKNGVDFIAAYLGNNANKADFIESQCERPDMSSWHISAKEADSLKTELKSRHLALDSMLKKKEQLSLFKQEYSSFKTEKDHFYKFIVSDKTPISIRETDKVKKSTLALELCLEVEYLDKLNWISKLFKSIASFFRLKKTKRALINDLLNKYDREDLIVHFQRKYYELRQLELTESIASLTKELEHFDFDKKMQEYSDLSLKLFQSSLEQRFGNQSFDKYELKDLKNNSANFIRDYPVILSTTYSLRGSLSSSTAYDYVIIDESSQVDICTGSLALSCAKNTVIVGDLMQLSHVVDKKMASATDKIFHKFNLSDAYRYKSQNLLSALVQLFPSAPRTLLREHYRCHPKIIEFCNRKFYGGKLIILTEETSDLDPLVIYKTVEGNHERDRVNQRQIDVIKNEVILEQKISTEDGSLGIITPYRKQTNALQKAFEGMNVKADTVDKFQGQENDIVILSTVDNEISDFADNANRLNVAISRAIHQLIVIVNDTDTLKDTNLGDLVKYVEYNNLSVIQSKTHSVFDYLFKSYAERRRELLKKTKKISKFDSENVAYKMINDVIDEMKITTIGVATHVPLRMILSDMTMLDEVERKFASFYKTHVDFLLFDKVTKEIKLIIEVDGASFHKEGSRQAERDKLKDQILAKYELSILRLGTQESGEEDKLMQVFNGLVI